MGVTRTRMFCCGVVNTRCCSRRFPPVSCCLCILLNTNRKLNGHMKTNKAGVIFWGDSTSRWIVDYRRANVVFILLSVVNSNIWRLRSEPDGTCSKGAGTATHGSQRVGRSLRQAEASSWSHRRVRDCKNIGTLFSFSFQVSRCLIKIIGFPFQD